MNWQWFIFSSEPVPRVQRHLAFLVVLGAIFFFQSIVPGKSIYETAFFSFCCFYPTCIFSVYYCLFVLYPVLTKRKSKLLLIPGLLFLTAACLFINYHTAGIFLWLADDFGKPAFSAAQKMDLSFINTSHALIIGGLALGIRFAKNLYQQQRENTALTRQKIITELRMEKTRIYPRLLYKSLNNIKSDLLNGSSDNSGQLLKVSELLSYILYDNNEKFVALEKELEMVRQYLDIERSGSKNKSSIALTITGDPQQRFIAPMTLFALLENVFRLLTNDHVRPEIDILVEDDLMRCRMVVEISNRHKQVEAKWREAVNNIRETLSAINPDHAKVELEIHPDCIILDLIAGLHSRKEDQTEDSPRGIEQYA